MREKRGDFWAAGRSDERLRGRGVGGGVERESRAESGRRRGWKRKVCMKEKGWCK